MAAKAALTFLEARQLFSTASFMRDDLPDGMWPELEELRDTWKESAKDASAQVDFIEDLERIFTDWGFSL